MTPFTNSLRLSIFILSIFCLMTTISMAEAPGRLRYSISPVRPGDYSSFAVTLSLQGSTSGKSVLSLPFEQGLYRPQDQIRIVQVTNVADHGLMPSDSSQYILHHSPRAILQVTYTISNALKDPAPSLDEVYAQMLTRNYFYLLGSYAWITPVDSTQKPYDISLNWKEFPADWRFLNSFQNNIRSGRFEATTDDLKNAIYLGGDIRIHALRINQKPLYFGIRGQWSFSDQEIFGVIQKTVRSQRTFWNDYDVDRYTVSLIPMKYNSEQERSINGRGLTNTFVTVGTNTKAFGLGDLVYLYNHELMHHWFGHVMKQPDPENAYKWFFEGFTDFFAHQVMLESGLWDSAEYNKRFNLVLAGYYSDSSHQWSNERLTKEYWSSYAMQKLPYQRGQIFALYLDESIRKYSSDRSSLKSVIQEMFDQTKRLKTAFTIPWFLQSLNNATGKDYGADLDRFIIQGTFISIDNWKQVTSILELQPVEFFDLGFAIDRETMVLDASITHVNAGSNAEKAGLRPGDRIAGFSTKRNPSEPTTVVVKRGEEKIRIAYLASRQQYLPQIK